MADCFCDYDPPEFYHHETRRAKKEHQCSECGRAIETNECYELVRGKWEGIIETYKTCPRCLALKEWVKAHVPCSCWYHGGIIDDAIEVAQSYAHEAPGLLFGAYRRKVAIMRQRRKIMRSNAELRDRPLADGPA